MPVEGGDQDARIGHVAPQQLQRQRACSLAWTETLTAVLPRLEARLQALDAAISLKVVAGDDGVAMQFGAAFQTDPTVLFSPGFGSKESSYPAYSNHFIVYVTWPTVKDNPLRREVERQLNRSLPMHVDYRIIAKTGFILDQDFLDITGLS